MLTSSRRPPEQSIKTIRTMFLRGAAALGMSATFVCAVALLTGAAVVSNILHRGPPRESESLDY
jgi:hypothetical protein